jgi:four helix bundle protein
MEYQLNHEKLEVYQVAIQFLAFASQTIKIIPSGYGFLSDQLKRASLSIPLNIAEGNGKFTKDDKAKFYKIARGSANECGAILDALKTMELLESDSLAKGKQLLYRIVCMLCKMF